MVGRVHSVETLGALDGPGLRCVIFLQGCPLRCAYCHNPDTWDARGGKEMTAAEIVAFAGRYRPFFGREGGVTLSGGEPLLQAAFAADILRQCRAAGIHTVLDTSGQILNDEVYKVLEHTDLALLDVKSPDSQVHLHLTTHPLATTMAFLKRLERQAIRTWVRHVVVPGITDSKDGLMLLVDLVSPLRCIERVELLGYHSMARAKWRALGLAYRLDDVRDCDADHLASLQAVVDEQLSRRRCEAGIR